MRRLLGSGRRRCQQCLVISLRRRCRKTLWQTTRIENQDKTGAGIGGYETSPRTRSLRQTVRHRQQMAGRLLTWTVAMRQPSTAAATLTKSGCRSRQCASIWAAGGRFGGLGLHEPRSLGVRWGRRQESELAIDCRVKLSFPKPRCRGNLGRQRHHIAASGPSAHNPPA